MRKKNAVTIGDLEKEPTEKFKVFRQRREKSRAVTACATAQFFLEAKLIQPLVALPPTNPLTSLLADNLIGRGEVAPVENA